MSQPESSGPSQTRPTHLSVASSGTNASCIAESTLSYASDFTVSQFPVPPQTSDGSSATPTTPTLAHHYPPAIPDYGTPTHFEFGTPPSSRSGSRARSNTESQPGVDRTASDYRSTKSGVSSSTQKTERPDVPPLQIAKPLKTNGRLPGVSSPSSTLVATAHSWKRFSNGHPPVSSIAFHKRPESPASLVAESSIYNWSDSGSGISVNPSEERLLSTSFITSLLSQSPEPRLAPEKPSGKTKCLPGSTIHTGRSRTSATTNSSKNTRKSAAPTDTHQSFPASVSPSDLYTAEGLPSPDPRRTLMPTADESRTISGRPSTEENSEMLHATEGQLVSAVRTTSLAFPRGMSIARAVNVEPAYLVPASNSRNSMGPSEIMIPSSTSARTSTSFASKPPSHTADTPQDVRMNRPFDAHGIPRVSEEDSMRPTAAEQDNSPAYGAGPSRRSRLQRNNSLKSVVSSLVSRISHTSAAQRARYMAWLRNRPLPPLPPLPNPAPGLAEREDIKKSEEGIPLPMLVKRADMLRGKLNSGFSRAGSLLTDSDYRYKEGSNVAVEHYADGEYSQISGGTNLHQRRSSLFSRISRMRNQHGNSQWQDAPPVPPLPNIRSLPSSDSVKRRKRRRLGIIIACILIVLVIVIAIPVGVVEHNKHHNSVVCNGNMTGAACTLDATCECTTSDGTCKPLARSLALLVPTVNSIFAANFTGSQLSDAVVSIVGTSTSGLCTKQAKLVDVEPGLDSASAPNRTAWAQAAILWNIGMSEDVNATTTLQEFVSSAPWKDLSSADGPTTDPSSGFAFVASGFTFDFALQSVAPLKQTFVNTAKPTDAQLGEVSVVAGQVLDRMYSYATASSAQRLKTLQNYWTSVLQQQASDLAVFKGAVQASPFLLPFDATSSPGGQPLTQLMSNTSNTPFPPPLACYPGLNSTALNRINQLETSVFGLSPATSPSQFSTSCFPNRPVYGVVDLLRMRLPFPDNRSGVALQASALSSDATVRAVIYSGEVLSALPGATSLPPLQPSTTDPREFGTSNALNHVLLNYLSSISNITLAMELVSHVLASTGPPANGSDLANALTAGQLPTLEVALFGSVLPQDLAMSVSSFSTPSGGLFFGSNAGQTFRDWALVGSSETIAWTQGALATEVVHETPTINSNFESVWKPASELTASGSTDASDVQKVISSLNSLDLFSLS